MDWQAVISIDVGSGVAFKMSPPRPILPPPLWFATPTACRCTTSREPMPAQVKTARSASKQMMMRRPLLWLRYAE